MAATSKSYPWENREARIEFQRLSKRLVRASDVKAEAVEYLDSAAAGRFPRGLLTLIAGRPKQGKSLLSNWLAGEVTRAGGSVIVSNPEDMLATMKLPRMQAADADCGRVHFWPGKIRLPDDVEELETLVMFHGVDLVVIDPIRKHVGHNVSQALEPLAAMAERTGVAVVLIHHLTKSASNRAPDVLGEVVAYRAWRVVGSLRLPMLASVTFNGTIWHPQRWTIADCGGKDTCDKSLGDAAGLGVPGERCTCGLYAARDREHLVSMAYNRFNDDAHPVFIGQVGLAGKVIPGSQGWRAEKGRVIRLYVPHHLAKYAAPLERLYGVDVELTNTFAGTPATSLDELAARLRAM